MKSAPWIKRFSFAAIPIFIVLSLLLVSGCEKLPGVSAGLSGVSAGKNSYYLIGGERQKEELRQLFHTLEEESDNPEGRFIILQEIIKIFHILGDQEKLNLLLTTIVEKDRDDPFNAYYLLIVAQNYREMEAYPFAIHYFERIIRNYPDLLVRGESVHFICLSNLINMVPEPEIRVQYYKELLSRFDENIDHGPIYYYLAKTYEALGEWDLSIQAYKNYLKYPASKIFGSPNAKEKVRAAVNFYEHRNKDWLKEDLNQLVNSIQHAIRTRNARILSQYRSKANFFTISWEENRTEANQEFLAGLGTFMSQRVGISSVLDRDSNQQEAYLQTWGWSYRIETWYFYFRRVHFPSDPDLHGQWEWAGIYFGEKPFAGSSNFQ